jgi:hypothetical protein
MKSFKKNKLAVAALAAGAAIASASPALACYTDNDKDDAQDSYDYAYNLWSSAVASKDSEIAYYESAIYHPGQEFCWSLPSQDQEECIHQNAVDYINFKDSLDVSIGYYADDLATATDRLNEVLSNPCS